jgi:hypothetical protein
MRKKNTLKQNQIQSQNVIVHVHNNKPKSTKKRSRKRKGGGGGVQVIQPVYKTVVSLTPQTTSIEATPNYDMRHRNITDVNRAAQQESFQQMIDKEQAVVDMHTPENSGFVRPIAQKLSSIYGTGRTDYEYVVPLSEPKPSQEGPSTGPKIHSVSMHDNPLFKLQKEKPKEEAKVEAKVEAKEKPKEHHHKQKESHLDTLDYLMNKYEREKDVKEKDLTRVHLQDLAGLVAREYKSESLEKYLRINKNPQAKTINKRLREILTVHDK